jgi:excisionase family DNA binding protein
MDASRNTGKPNPIGELEPSVDALAGGALSALNQPNAEKHRSAWLTAGEAARYLSVEPRTVLVWARQGKLKGFKLSGTKRHIWRFRHCDLDAMLTGPSVALRTKGAQ